MSVLQSLGWGPFFQSQIKVPLPTGAEVARVVEEQKRYHFVATERGALLARINGKLRHGAGSRAHLPSVGDFVIVQPRHEDGTATITQVLERRSKLSRKEPGTEDEQVLCANVDVAFVVQGLDGEPNLRRLERFLATAARGNVKAVVVLTKADLRTPDDVRALVGQVQALAPCTPVLAVNAPNAVGLDDVRTHLGPGVSAVVVGPSGAGKSTLLNHLAGQDLRAVSQVRQWDNKGRHTTTARTLFTLADGTLLIDTPGIREIEPWDAAPGLDEVFDDIKRLSADCRFRDCTHQKEPGCVVRAAVDAGSLPRDRYEAFIKLQTEARLQREKQSPWLKPRR
ncbi:MAG: ribosome small subunit-dependent GTPase A [Deltaproteobacteria bacterium]|nr:ribosome small subunit-dependent GTPase A [Deltaproteobacteria bacterium]